MSCKVQQSVCSDCVTYVKSRIKFNTFNTFNNVEQRKFSERDFPALVEARRYTELLRSMEAGRDALLAFPDGSSLDSFRQTAYRENMRGDGPVCYRLRINWPQKVASVKPITREEYEREKRSGLDT